MSSIIKQIKQREYETDWFNFLNSENINMSTNEIQESVGYSKEFQYFIIKKAKHYIKQNFSSLERIQVSRTYSTCFGNTERDKLNIEVQTLVNQFWKWKKKDDDEIRKEINELIVNTKIKILQEQEELKSIKDRIKALDR